MASAVPDITPGSWEGRCVKQALIRQFFWQLLPLQLLEYIFFFLLNSSRFVFVWAEVENWEITDPTIIDFIRNMNVLHAPYIKNSLLLYWPRTLCTTFMGPEPPVLPLLYRSHLLYVPHSLSRRGNKWLKIQALIRLEPEFIKEIGRLG